MRMSDFAKEIHNMFDHIWDCEIDHPAYQDTVGELMEAVIQAYEKHNLTHGTNLAEVGTDCISRQAAIDATKKHYRAHDNDLLELIAFDIEQLPSAQPKRGRWHYSDGKPARIGLSFGVICDQCGTESEYCTNFCGECGADMRQKGENSESD